ncbi:DUF2892 family protein [Natronomonas moolapensis 8.8.11]|uniref:DUF2892 family protein n=1 Tax=Natronomonas moolapensis (strain DSM 18674 / CECT 7526 / JCM 14361 / 8.8.11) TaxID=268739 RepID=M1XP10_NATM8|nr:DUF2892 domain-containing protein [Natronomonas moolapensis]CCQ35743.1 DUF2892 family protein [Natronomonas moolapensis 8.8.11]
MKKNVGGTDRVVRLVLGSALIVAGIAGYAGLLPLAAGSLPQALTAVVVFVLGAVLLATGLIRRCPLNRLVGLDTY